MRKFFLLPVIVAGFLNIGCAPLAIKDTSEDRGRTQLISEMKKFEVELGWTPTNNFLSESQAKAPFGTCYFTKRFELELHMEFPVDACNKEPSQFDTFFYRPEAVAGVGAPISPEMRRSSLARFIMVVFHEDFHEQLREVPSWTINESATTLIGLMVARDFARTAFGEGNELVSKFESDINVYLGSAHTIIRYHHELGNLYGAIGRGEMSQELGQMRKAELFGEIASACASVTTHTLSSCKKISNNAMFAREFVYAHHYPLFYHLSVACKGETRKTAEHIIALAREELTEAKFLERVRSTIINGCNE